MSTNQATNSGISFLGMLTLIFIALKLTNFIHWSWWWVLAPLWIPWALLIVGFIVYIGWMRAT